MLVRFAGLFRRKQRESEMKEELRAHLDALIERNVVAGMTHELARVAALRAFGGVEQIKERSRDERRSMWGEQVYQDIRYAILFPRQANAVFVEMPEHVIGGLLKKGWIFYTFIGKGGSRLMCSWDTTEEDVMALVKDIKTLLKAPKPKEKLPILFH